MRPRGPGSSLIAEATIPIATAIANPRRVARGLTPSASATPAPTIGTDNPANAAGNRIHPTAHAIRNYALVRQEWSSAVATAAAGDPAVETALPLLARVRAGLVRLRQGDGRR